MGLRAYLVGLGLWVLLLGPMGLGGVALAEIERTFSVQYDEPTMNEDGSALDDLAQTLIEYKYNYETEWNTLSVPASSATGGGAVNQSITHSFADTLTQADVTSREIRVYAVDMVGNTGDPIVQTDAIVFDLTKPGQIRNLNVTGSTNITINISIGSQ